MNLVKEDFYCGAFLSYLLNNKIVPTLFDDNNNLNRKIYDFTTYKGDYRAYIKSSEKPSSPANEHKQYNIWTFPFTENQIEDIKSLKNNINNRELNFIFVCGQPKLSQSKIAVINTEILFKCIDVNRKDKYKQQNIKIKLRKGSWNFGVYGTNWDDKINGRDNTLSVGTNSIDYAFL